MSPKSHVILAREFEERIDTYGREVVEDALRSLGFRFEALAAYSMKVLAPTDQVEYLPKNAWNRQIGTDGLMKYVVNKNNNGEARVVVTHTDGREPQRHPPKGGYKDKSVVAIHGTVMHFPQ